MTKRWKLLLFSAGVVAALAASSSLPAATDVERARELATTGHRDEAIRLLEERLSQNATDTDARTLLGTVFSWEGRYDEARTQLEMVLAENPTHGDALPALINVELWSDHPSRAESLAARALDSTPDDVNLLTDHARALSALGRKTEALGECERVLTLDPHNKVALELKVKLTRVPVLWQVGVSYTYDQFTQGVGDWHEGQLYAKRKMNFGSLIGRINHAERFGLTDEQLVGEAYVRFRPGTYAWFATGYSPEGQLYPRYSLGFDVYQSLPKGLECSVGYRWLEFGSPVNIFVGYLGKYWSTWLFGGRIYVTPGDAGTSRSYSLFARNYFGDALGYYGFRYGRGRSPEEIQNTNTLEVLNSQVLGAELVLPLPRRWEFDARVNYGVQDRANRTGLHQFSTTVGFYYSF